MSKSVRTMMVSVLISSYALSFLSFSAYAGTGRPGPLTEDQKTNLKILLQQEAEKTRGMSGEEIRAHVVPLLSPVSEEGSYIYDDDYGDEIGVPIEEVRHAAKEMRPQEFKEYFLRLQERAIEVFPYTSYSVLSIRDGDILAQTGEVGFGSDTCARTVGLLILLPSVFVDVVCSPYRVYRSCTH